MKKDKFHTYLILEDENSTSLVHTSHFKENAWLYIGAKIVEILKSDDYDEAHKSYVKYLALK